MATRDPFSQFEEAERDVRAAESAERGEPQEPASEPQREEPEPKSRRTSEEPDYLSQLLGNEPAREEPEPEPRAEPQPDETPHSVPYDRFKEVLDQNKRYMDLVDRLARRDLEGATEPQPRDPYAGLPDEQREVAQLIDPVLRHVRERDRQELLQELQPVIDAANEQAGLRHLKSRVPGFKDDLMAEVNERFEQMPADLQRHYRGPAGAEALAWEILHERGQVRQEGPRANVNRAHSVTRSTGMEPKRRQFDVNDIPDDKLDDVIELVKNQGTGGGNPNEPDSFLY